jgi:type II secretory pathway predicted ATPase ExeA
VWLRHWGLAHDPFVGTHSAYVPLPSHEEALARLLFSIERQQRIVTLFAEAGLGKTTVVRQVAREARSPRRRTVLVHAPSDGHQLLGLLADGLGLPFTAGSEPERVWRSLARALRSASIEGRHVVFLIDGWDRKPDAATLKDLTALLEVGGPRGTPVSLVRVGRGIDADADDCGDSRVLAIGLERLTRSESDTYLGAKLAAGGCRDRVLTPRAITRLHSWSEGVPRALEQLAALSMMAGASQGLEVVTPEVVDGVALRSLVGADAGIASS